jgi:hypothetical protein
MKLDDKIPDKENVEIVGQKEVKKNLTHVATIRPHRGHTLFEVNTRTGMIAPVQFEQVDADFRSFAEGRERVHKKVIEKPDCIYISALNKKNVVKKLADRFVQLKREGKL